MWERIKFFLDKWLPKETRDYPERQFEGVDEEREDDEDYEFHG